MSNTSVYTIRTLSNLHVGAGDRSFGIIDKHIQRDHATDLPIIFGSSIKGALREMVECQPNGKTRAAELFGADNSPGANAPTLRQGQLSFADARLLALPVRSSHQYFYWATTKTLLDTFISDMEARTVNVSAKEELKALKEFAYEPDPGRPYLLVGDRPKTKNEAGEEATQDVYFELWFAENPPTTLAAVLKDSLSKLIGPRVALLHDNDFATLAADLPVLARNSLNNGISTQLWYEEVVPREAVFYCCVDTVASATGLADLNESLQTNRHFVQLGGNATVGYGRTKWVTVNLSPHA